METRKNTLLLLERMISNGLTNCDLDFFVDDKQVTFKDYLGAITANGGIAITDIVPAGLFVWGIENHLGIPDSVFTTEDGSSVAFYKLTNN